MATVYSISPVKWIPQNTSNVNDPVYEALFEAGGAASTLEGRNRIVGELDLYAIEKFWQIWGPLAPHFQASQPWVMGYNGEFTLGGGQSNTVFTRLWIGQDLKKEMGR